MHTSSLQRNVRVARVETTSPESSSPLKGTEEVLGGLSHVRETGGSLPSCGACQEPSSL